MTETRAQRIARLWVEYDIEAKLAEPIRIIETICWFPPKEEKKQEPSPEYIGMKGYSKTGKKLGRPRKNPV